MRYVGLTLGLLLASAAWPQTRKTIFVMTDAEGVAGICRQEQTDPKDPELRELLTGEVNAAVQGFLDGGADEVVVADGHDGSRTLSIRTIHPKAKLLMGAAGVTETYERRYAGMAFIGQHSMANTRGGIMAHSFDSLGIQNMLLNGKPVGEIEIGAALAGAFGTPVLLLTGDRAAADELHRIVPQAELAIVKEGLSRYTCISMSAQAARDEIRAAAVRSMKKLGQIPPYKIEGPVTLTIERTTRNSLSSDVGRRPGAEVLDDRTVRITGKDFLEAWIRYRVGGR